MTAPADLGNDPIRAFSNALPPIARKHLVIDYRSIPVIRAACENSSPAELADVVSNGIGHRTPVNPWPLMWHRIRRAAGLLDNEQEVDV